MDRVANAIPIDAELWASTRAGARAGRGFRYQDAVAAWLTIEGWGGTEDWSAVIPEGLDDVTLHNGTLEIRAQLKSRHDPQAFFTIAEVARFLAKTAREFPNEWNTEAKLHAAVVLERSVRNLPSTGWTVSLAELESAHDIREHLARELSDWDAAAIDALLSRSHLIVEANPMDRAVARLETKTSMSGAAARLVAQKLRERAGAAADGNYTAEAAAPAALGATEVQAQIEAVNGLIDPVGFLALTAGLCEAVDFSQPVVAPDFYSGVDVTPGHVAAGLVFERPALVAEALESLQSRGATLIAGPSGAGKSALAWLAANATRHTVRWHRLRSAKLEDIGRLIQIARTMDVSPEKPVGFVVDDVGRDEATSGWDGLVREIGTTPGLMLLGTAREEDIFPLRSLSRLCVVRPTLDEALAERIWRALKTADATAFSHWREPYDLSLGLLLEYTHLLTQGRRLVETLTEQVRRRLEEARDDELKVLAIVAFATAHGATVDVFRLREKLAWEPPRLARALQRLVDEHTIRRTADDGLMGLHEIRSRHLDKAIQDLLGAPRSAALIGAVESVRPEDFARFVVRLLRAWPDQEDTLIEAAAERLHEPETPIEAWIGLLHGLGLATADRVAQRWLEVTEPVELDARQTTLAFTFAVAGLNFGEVEPFAKLNEAIDQFAQIQVPDLRKKLVNALSDEAVPPVVDLGQAHDLNAAMLPLGGCIDTPTLRLELDGDFNSQPLIEVLELIQTVRAISPEHADHMVAHAGGSEALLERIYHEVPWITRPSLGVHEGEVSVVGYVRFIAEELQPDLNAEVVRLCELMSIAAPQAEWLISDAIFPDGKSFGFGEHFLNRKCMRRSAIATPTRVAWNRAQVRALGRLVGEETQTNRTTALARAIEELAVQLRQAAEFFCRQERPGAWWQGLATIRQLMTSFIRPPRDIEEVTSPRDQGSYGGYDAIHGFAVDAQRLVGDLTAIEMPQLRLMAYRAQEMAKSAAKLNDPALWTMTEEDPLPAIETIVSVVWEITAVLNDADVDVARLRSSALRLSKTSRRHSALARAARDAQERTARDTQKRCAEIADLFAAQGLEVEVLARAHGHRGALALTNACYLAVLDVEEIAEWFKLEASFIAVTQHLPDYTRLAFAPRYRGIIAHFALEYMQTVMPCLTLARDWQGAIPYPILEDSVMADFARILNILTLVSTIIQSQDRPLLAVEEDFLGQQLEQFTPQLERLGAIVAQDEDAVVGAALSFAIELFERVKAEWEGMAEGDTVAVEAITLTPPSPLNLQTIVLNIMLATRAIDLLAAPSIEAQSG